MTDSIRYTLILDAAANNNVEELQKAYSLRSKAAVFDLAARFLLWVSQQQALGYRVGRSDGKEFSELLLPLMTRPVIPDLEKLRTKTPEINSIDGAATTQKTVPQLSVVGVG
jgi:hypothetical protein